MPSLGRRQPKWNSENKLKLLNHHSTPSSSRQLPKKKFRQEKGKPSGQSQFRLSYVIVTPCNASHSTEHGDDEMKRWSICLSKCNLIPGNITPIPTDGSAACGSWNELSLLPPTTLPGDLYRPRMPDSVSALATHACAQSLLRFSYENHPYGPKGMWDRKTLRRQFAVANSSPFSPLLCDM